MADVFISYKAEDRARVAPLVDAIAAEGLSIWWDAHISAGDEWRESIQHELEAASCVIVVWSTRSVAREGRFVRDEATRAERRGVYLPVRIDPVEPPLGFGETQALDLVGWNGRRDDPRFAAFVAAVRAVIAREPRPAVFTAPAHAIDRRLLLAGGGAAVLLMAGAGAWWSLRGGQGAGQGLAVLPFRNLSGDASQDYFGEGIAEELRSALARLPGLEVIARISSEAVGGLDAEAAAAKLGVGNILTGSIRHSPSIVRVNAQLVNGDTGLDAWSETYDRPAGDALSIQSEIAAEVAGALGDELTGGTVALPSAGTSNSAAHDLILQASKIDAHEDGEDSVRRVLALAEGALALDPDYAAAKAAQAGALSTLAVFYTADLTARRAAFDRAAAVAREAIALDPKLPKAYRTLAYIQKSQLDFRAAFANYRQANALGADGGSLIAYSFFLTEMGRSDEAVVAARQAAKVDPLNPDAYAALGNAEYYARRYDTAIKWLRRMMEMAPDRYYGRYFVALSLSAQGKMREATAELAGMPEGNLFRNAAQAVVSARAGDRAGSDRALAQIPAGDGHMLRAAIHVQRAERDKALALIEMVVADGDADASALKADPLFDPLRDDPRFRAQLAKLDFP